MFQTLNTLFRARAAEAEEALVDRNAVSLLAQHLRDAKTEIARSRAAVARLMARRTERGRNLDALAGEILKREGEARKAIRAGEDDLAADIADAVIALEDRKAAETAADLDLAARIDDARARLAASEAQYRSLADQLRAAREASLSRVPPGIAPRASALEKAVETAATLKARDARLADLEDAYRKLDEAPEAQSLDARIEAAGLDDARRKRREDLMKRLASKGDKK